MPTKVEANNDIPRPGSRDAYLDVQPPLCVAFTLIALGYVAAPLVLQLHLPVIHIRLSSEDYWVEYGTFAGWALTTFFLGRLALQPEPWHQRAIWAVIAVVTALVALEEISWGQRILGLRTPELLLEVNRQKELNLHNIEGAKSWIWKIWLGWGLIAWTIISVAVLLARRRFNVDPMATGLPFFPLRLSAFCLIVVWIIFEMRVFKAGEYHEFAIALLALIWAADLYAHFSTRPTRLGERLLRNRFTAFIAAAAIASTLTLTFPGNHKWALNKAATHYFPEAGLMEQSREVFDYILANPQYVNDETLANYRRLFPDQNDQ